MSTSKFGEEFSNIWPSKSSSQIPWSDVDKQILNKGVEKLTLQDPLSVEDLIEKSNKFPVKFPINTCRIIEQPLNRRKEIEKFAATAYPVIHERVLWLYSQFLQHKIKHGTDVEKEIYKNMTIVQFVQRLLDKRNASFFAANDKFLLVSGERGASGFVEVGSDGEKFPLILKNCLSYDEIKLSALMSVSSYTEFINAGHRTNVGVVETDKNLIEVDGVIIGMIGARLSRRDLMEFQDIVVSKTQNTIKNGYGSRPEFVEKESERRYDFRQVWSKFYEEPSLLFSTVSEMVKKKNPRFGPSKNKNDFFDNLLMKKRYTISFDTLLLESESRGKAANKNVFIHVVGIGLGVWKACPHQEEIFLETFEQRINHLIDKLPHVSHIHFSWFKLDSYGAIRKDNILKSQSHPNGGIKVFISKRNPADKLKDLEDTLLVVSYAWDGNALPGNEFWMGLLKSTGDSSSACSTLITELHNPHINTPRVCGDNLHIAAEQHGIIHISEYVKTIV